jgi:hypothetical protein
MVQWAWNLVFFGLSFCLLYAQQSTNKITLDLVRTPYWGDYSKGINWNDSYWKVKFYCNGKPLDDDSDETGKEATPFQVALRNSEADGSEADVGHKLLLDPEGLNFDLEGSNPDNPRDRALAFDRLPEKEARAYIENFNRKHNSHNGFSYLLEGLFFALVASLLGPFWFMLIELFIVACIFCPIGMAYAFGPTVYQAAGAWRSPWDGVKGIIAVLRVAILAWAIWESR